jgi:hypothetical protein
MWHDEETRRRTFAGQELVTELGRAVIIALQDAGLHDELALIRERVFSQPAPRLFSTHVTPGGAWSLRYKPMVELMLLHVRDAAASACSDEERQGEIRWAVEMAGF